MPINPKQTHNYLERIYSRAAIIDGEYKLETKTIVTSPVYNNYYVYRE